jgi:chorismate mutase
MIRGVRGAITVEENSAEEILQATIVLLTEITKINEVAEDSIASILFSTTPDLNAAFPAAAARQMGWVQVPMMCAQEIAVPGGLPKCIRVLMMINTEKKQEEIQHAYMRGARALRPDLA